MFQTFLTRILQAASQKRGKQLEDLHEFYKSRILICALHLRLGELGRYLNSGVKESGSKFWFTSFMTIFTSV